MDDKNKNPTTEEPIGGDAPVTESGPVLTDPEQPPLTPEVETPAPEDNVIPFGAAGTDLPGPDVEPKEDTRPPWEKTQDELNAQKEKPKRGRAPKAAEQTGPEGDKKPEDKAPRKGRPPKADKTAPDKAAPEKTAKPPRDKVSQSKKAPGKGGATKETAPAPAPEPPPDPANIPRPVEQGQVVYLKLSELHAFHTFRDHPYKVQDDDKMKELVGTIREHGVMTPATVRPEKDGNGYEIIAGHRRQHGSQLAGLAEMPCIVRDMTDLEAVREMKISNKQRGDPLPSELARLFDLEVEAIKHQGGRLDGVAAGSWASVPWRLWVKTTV